MPTSTRQILCEFIRADVGIRPYDADFNTAVNYNLKFTFEFIILTKSKEENKMEIIKVEGMHCAMCVKRISDALKEAGIDAEISLENKTVSVDISNLEKAKEEIEDLGFEV